MTEQATTHSRAPRTTETREKEARVDSWRPAHDLPQPTPQPGYEFRYIRKSHGGQDDLQNMAKARREGWVPCKMKDHPEFADDLAAFGVTATNEIVEIGGLVLCKTTTELLKQRQAYYADYTHKATVAVNNNYLREQDRRMPMFNESSGAKFGRGF